MTKDDFVKELARLVQKHAKEYGILVCSPIIAQGILESAYGTSDKVFKNGEYRHNYFGLKWRDKRCAISNDYFEEYTKEQNPDGSYKTIVSRFCKFKSMEDGVIGYFQWINTKNYSNLKGVTDPYTYLKNIKADKYATSINYVENLMNVIKKLNLTQYDVPAGSQRLYRVQLIYVNPIDAKIILEKLKSLGFKDAFIKNDPVNKLYRIQIGAYSDKIRAEEKLKELKRVGYLGYIKYS